MAKKVQAAACTCPVCSGNLCKACSFIALVVGVCFLLQDLAIWNFWGLSWYTIGFLMVGATFLFSFKK
jgi:hypothetical protein